MKKLYKYFILIYRKLTLRDSYFVKGLYIAILLLYLKFPALSHYTFLEQILEDLSDGIYYTAAEKPLAPNTIFLNPFEHILVTLYHSEIGNCGSFVFFHDGDGDCYMKPIKTVWDIPSGIKKVLLLTEDRDINFMMHTPQGRGEVMLSMNGTSVVILNTGNITIHRLD